MKQDLKNVVASVKEAYDLAEYMRSEGSVLLPAGVGRWKTICKFHNDSNPSLTITDSFQRYKCWPCGASGDLVNYVMYRENLGFREAVVKLAEARGIAVDLEESEASVDFESLKKILRASALFYCRHFDSLEEDHRAKVEVTKRGLTFDNAASEHIRYGFAPSGNKLLEFLKKQGFSEALMVEAGVVREKEGRYFDFFRGRLLMVFTDRYGKPVGFTARKLLDDDPMPGKYVNSPEGPIFHKSSVLYNHAYARKSASRDKVIYIAEGQFDVAAIYEAGITSVVAASGTAFTRSHGEECRRMAGPGGSLVFCFDGDEAGAKAAARVFTSLPELHEDAYVVTFPPGEDPCSFRKDHGEEALREHLTKQVPLVEFMIRRAREKYDLSSTVERAKFVDEAASMVKTVQNPTLRDNCLRLLALDSFTPLETVKEAVAKVKPYQFQETPTPRPSGEVPPEEGEEDVAPEEVPQEELDLQALEDLITHDSHYALVARFFSLGLTRRAWREALLRSEDLTPREFHPLLRELATLRDREAIFPELFEHEALARFLMERDFSGFYKFMDLEELKGQFIYLHERLKEAKILEARDQEDMRLREVLASDPAMSVDFFEKLLERTSA